MKRQPARRQYTQAEKAAYYKKLSAPQQRIPRQPVQSRALQVAKPRAVEKAPGMVSRAGQGVGGAIGSALGPVGTAIGSFLGGKLGHLVEKVTGFGDYKVEQNSVLVGGMNVPQIVNSVEKGGVIIRHREFIQDIVATTAFTNQSFLIQPGLARTFPWLSQIANSFEQYRIRGMMFDFVSTSSDALLSSATSTALGTVVMMTDYDVADSAPTSKREMLQSEFASSDKPSCTFIHPIECKKSVTAQNILYTRGAIAPPENFDQRLYDFASFNIATEGMQAAGGVLGELWVTYEIELLKPQFSYFGLADHYRMNTITTARPFGTVLGSNIGAGATLGGAIAADALSYRFPPEVTSGKFLVTYSVVGSAVASAHTPSFSITGGSLLSIQVNDTLAWINAPEPAATSGIIIITAVVTVTSGACYILLANNGLMPTSNNGDFWVVRLPDSIAARPT
nr:putative capsid protein [Crucivirus sp.]